SRSGLGGVRADRGGGRTRPDHHGESVVGRHRELVPEHHGRPVQHRHPRGLARDFVKQRHLLPDLAMVAAAVTLFYCLFLFQGYRQLFRDSDAGWHIRNGEAILATGHLPRTDPYSFTKFGQPWFAWEWAADVVVGAIHRAAGLRGVALFYGVAIAAGVWMWFRL